MTSFILLLPVILFLEYYDLYGSVATQFMVFSEFIKRTILLFYIYNSSLVLKYECWFVRSSSSSFQIFGIDCFNLIKKKLSSHSLKIENSEDVNFFFLFSHRIHLLHFELMIFQMFCRFFQFPFFCFTMFALCLAILCNFYFAILHMQF